MKDMPSIRVGTSGFSFEDWKGTVYPRKLNLKDALCYYQEEMGFDCTEVNSTYYTLISDRSFAGMEAKTAPGFEFVVKGYRGFTHDPFDDRLKDNRPSLDQAKEDIRRFVYALGPLLEAKKLGAVLLQFPVFFYPSPESKEYLAECRELFGKLPLVIEFRNHGWSKPYVLDFLRSHALGYCTVDEPKLPRLMPFINEVTSGIGYMRLHGRNPDWFNAPISQRYHYLYSDKELKEFVPEIKKMDKKAKKTYVFFNNCHAGLAARNAMKLKDMMGLPSFGASSKLALSFEWSVNLNLWILNGQCEPVSTNDDAGVSSGYVKEE